LQGADVTPTREKYDKIWYYVSKLAIDSFNNFPDKLAAHLCRKISEFLSNDEEVLWVEVEVLTNDGRFFGCHGLVSTEEALYENAA